MTATTSATRANRVAPYFDEPRNTLPLLPATPADREALLTDAVFAAVAALQGLLTHSDPKVVMKAAGMILNLETTRQRHGRDVIGTETREEPLPVFTATERSGGSSAAPFSRGEELMLNHANPLDVFVEKVRAELQRHEDAEGTGVVVSRAQAEECARYIQANAHRTSPPDPTPAGDDRKNRPDRVVRSQPGGTFDGHPDAQR